MFPDVRIFTSRSELENILIDDQRRGEYDFSRSSFSGLDLSGLDLSNLCFGNYQTGYGANFSNTILINCNLSGAVLCYANFTQARLRRANLERADARRAIFIQADLERANANYADFYHADFTDAKLLRAHLSFISIHKVQFSGTELSIYQLGDELLEEDFTEAEKFRQKLNTQYQKDFELGWATRMNRALGIYRRLKANWQSIGYYSDASMAHFRERRIERQTHSPFHAADYHGFADKPFHQRLVQYGQHSLRWLNYWLIELICGYGESPFRTLITFFVVLTLFAVVYWLTGSVITSSDGTPASFLDNLIFSLGAMTTTSYEGLIIRPENPFRFLVGLQAFGGIALAGLLGFVLGNRIRHF